MTVSSPRLGNDHLSFIAPLRGLAALAVLFFHSLSAFDNPSCLPSSLAAVRTLTSYGYLGVSVFFAISGWCIAQRVSTAFLRRESTPLFLLERLLRIFPIYWAALIISLLLRLASLSFRSSPLQDNLPTTLSAWMGDIFLIQPYVGTIPFVMVSWSLVFESGFYVIAAGALLTRSKGIRSHWLIAGGVALCFWFLLKSPPSALFILERWPDFFAGVLAWWLARQNSRVAWIAGLAALFLLLRLTPLGWGDLTRCCAVGTAFILLVAARWPRPLPDISLLGWVGTISYSLYLIHVAVMSPWLNLAQRFVASSSPLFVVVWLVALLLGLAAGWTLHRGVELPFERWRKTFCRSRTRQLQSAA